MNYHALIMWQSKGTEFVHRIEAPDGLTLKARIDQARQRHGHETGFDVSAWQDMPDGARRTLLTQERNSGQPLAKATFASDWRAILRSGRP